MMRNKAVIYILFTLCFFATFLSAGKSAKAAAVNGGGYAASGQIENVGFMAQIYDATNGLPTSDANYILCTEDGYVWIGGYSGIIKYDGSSFERLDASDGLTSGRAIYEDSHGRIWIGTNDNGVVVIDKDEKKHLTYENGLNSSSIRTFAEGGDGNLYIGSTGGICYVDGNFRVHQVDDERVNNELIVRLTSDPEGMIYGNTKEGAVFTLRSGKIADYYTSEELGMEMVSTIFADNDRPGYVYYGTESNTVYYGKFGDITSFLKKTDVSPINSVYWISSACGRIWVTSENVTGYIDEKFQFHQLHDIPMNNSIDMMTSDYQGNLWFASSRQGVMKLVTNNFQNVTQIAGLNLEAVNATCLHNDFLYVGSDTGLSILNREYKPVFNSLTRYLQGTRIRCITNDRDNNLWISTYTNDLGLVCFNSKGEIKNYTVKDGLPSDKIRCVSLADDGSILVGTNEGLVVMKDGRIDRTVGASDVVTNTVFLTVCEGDDGTVYAGSDGDGIYAIGNAIRRLGRSEGLTSDVILKIKRDEKHDVIWIITSNSIEYMKNGVITPVTTFPYNNNFDIFPDESGNMWVLSSTGVYCVSADELLSDNVTRYRLYNYFNGLPGAPTANSFSEMDDEGNLYISERIGVCRVNINHFFEQSTNVKIEVRSISLNDEEIIPDQDGTYTIPAVPGRIQITPAILDYTLTNPMVNVFLDGAEEPGITTELSNLSTLEYTNLAYGDYMLHIQTLDNTTGKVIQDRSFHIVKKPRLFELLIVRVFCAIFVIALAGFVVWRFLSGTVITKQYEQIRKAKEEAERANTAKSRFLANMSHEIRTPINTIMGMDEMILREDAKDVPKGYFMSIINYALDIRTASESLLGLINDLLDISKIESGKMNLVEQGYDVGDLLRSIVTMIRVRSNEKELTFDVQVDENMPARLYGDSGKIKQILLNLLTNAVKYTEKGGFTLKVSIDEMRDEECDVRFSVKDTGIGVKPEDLDRLFTAYERLDEEKNSGIQGTGLGLEISRRFAELMGGKLWCESVYGEGSEFILTTTQKIEDKTPMGVFKEHVDEGAKGPYVPQFIAPDADILIVDDNPMNLAVIQGLLKATRMFITTATSGEECLEKIKYGSFNVVLLDHMMPGMDGVETVAKIREDHPDLPVYALTANTTVGEEFYLSKGFTGYLTKPIDSKTVELAIMKHLPPEMMMKPEGAEGPGQIEELPENMEWVKEIEGISMDDGVRNSGGIGAFINSLQLFHDTLDNSAKVIKTAFDEKDIKLFTIKVHALKSSARIVGAMGLSSLAEKLENAGNNGDTDFINANASKLLDDYLAFKDKLKKINEDAGGDDKPEISEGELNDAYMALRELIPQMDYDSVEMIIGNLKEYRLPDEDKTKISDLEKMLRTLDWDSMAQLIG